VKRDMKKRDMKKRVRKGVGRPASARGGGGRAKTTHTHTLSLSLTASRVAAAWARPLSVRRDTSEEPWMMPAAFQVDWPWRTRVRVRGAVRAVRVGVGGSAHASSGGAARTAVRVPRRPAARAGGLGGRAAEATARMRERERRARVCGVKREKPE